MNLASTVSACRPVAVAPRVTPFLRAVIAAVGIAVLLACLAGCTSLQPSPDQPAAPAPPAAEPAAEGSRARFSIAAGELDTWNAVGQILVRVEGVTYEGRSQMLGLYDVRYRGEPLLIVTRAQVIDTPKDEETTEVGVLRGDGEPIASAAAVELLDLLQQRLPAELARIAAGLRD